MKIISIINNKGGVGKTATTVNLGHALAREGKRILIIDNDPQCNATELLDCEQRANSLYQILDPEEKNIHIKDCIHGTDYENLFIIPNVPEVAIFEPIYVKQGKGLNILRNRVRKENLKFDFILIDNSPTLGVFVLSSLRASDLVIVPNEAGSRHSIKGLINAVKFIENERQEGNPNLNLLRVLFTKVDRRLNIHKAIISQVKELLPEEKIFNTMIPLNTDIQKAESKKQTIFRFKSNVSSAIAYTELAKEIINII